jgi:hypothetical protein
MLFPQTFTFFETRYAVLPKQLHLPWHYCITKTGRYTLSVHDG